MSELSELRDQAKEAGIKGTAKMDADTLTAALEAHERGPLVGVPTEPDKANLNEVELETAIHAGELIAPDVGPVVENLGVPTEPDKVGGAPPRPSEPLPSLPPPSHSGNDIEAGIGVPTEPDRGGLNATEISVTNSAANTAAGIAEAKKAKAAKKAAKKSSTKAAKT